MERDQNADQQGSSCAGENLIGSSMQQQAVFDVQEDLRLVATVASKQMRQPLLADDADSGAVLTVLGGKASCRRKFVVSVHLQDAQGRLVPRDLPIVASVAFAHDHLPVRPPDSGEPPLFTTFNGVEFSSHDNPTRMLGGRATFKLALSLLSSKYENRLFCICFTPHTQPAPLCPPCFSPPIRSISRKRTSGASSSSHLFIDGAGSPLRLSARITPASSSTPYLQAGSRFPHSRANHSTTYSELCSKHASCCYINGAEAAEHTSSVGDTSHTQHVNNVNGGAGQGFLICKPGGSAMDRHRLHAGDGQTPPLSHKPHWPTHGASYSDQNMTAQLMLSPTSTSAGSLICRNGYNTLHNNSGAILCRLNTPSPVDSGSPNSIVTLGSESSIDHQFSMKDDSLKSQVTSLVHNRSMQGSMGRPLSAPSPSVSSTRPLRPQASIGGCKIPFRNTSLTAGFSRTMPSFMQRPPEAVDVSQSGVDAAGGAPFESETTHQQSSRSFVLGTMQHLSAAAALATPVQQRLDSLMRSFMCSNGAAGNLSSRTRMCRSPLEDRDVRAVGQNHDQQGMEEEERAIHYLELSLYEVAMEIQKRKEEVRVKRRRTLDGEARLQYNQLVFHQPPSWLSNIMG